MLPFTKEKLQIEGQSIFYYDRSNALDSIEYFSKSIHQDLKEYLGVQREIRQREKMSEAITNQQKRFDQLKIFRIEMFYDYYVDQVLQMMQMLYYENFYIIDYSDKNFFIEEFKNLEQTGLKLQQCFDRALKICEDIKLMIEKQIQKEYPIETFQDKQQSKMKK